MNSKIIGVIFSMICGIIFSGCDIEKVPYEETRVLLGTYVTIKVSDQDETGTEKREAVNKAFFEIARIENLLSSFKRGNVIDKINNSGIDEVFLDEETFYVLEKAKYFYEISSGAFDITVMPLLELWGFYKKNYAVPNQEEISKVLKKIGADKMILNKEKKSVRFLVEGMKIDLGGIAKGYAVEKAIGVLKKNGIENALVACAGDIRVIGKRSKWKKWTVGIRDPLKKDNILEQVELEDSAISTSGSYERFFEIGGKKYCHIINPKTGRPAETDILSVTVIAGDCLTADALATAVFVLGKGKGLEVVNVLDGIRAIVVCDD